MYFPIPDSFLNFFIFLFFSNLFVVKILVAISFLFVGFFLYQHNQEKNTQYFYMKKSLLLLFIPFIGEIYFFFIALLKGNQYSKNIENITQFGVRSLWFYRLFMALFAFFCFFYNYFLMHAYGPYLFSKSPLLTERHIFNLMQFRYNDLLFVYFTGFILFWMNVTSCINLHYYYEKLSRIISK